jgi:hypothetical protein
MFCLPPAPESISSTFPPAAMKALVCSSMVKDVSHAPFLLLTALVSGLVIIVSLQVVDAVVYCTPPGIISE